MEGWFAQGSFVQGSTVQKAEIPWRPLQTVQAQLSTVSIWVGLASAVGLHPRPSYQVLQYGSSVIGLKESLPRFLSVFFLNHTSLLGPLLLITFPHNDSEFSNISVVKFLRWYGAKTLPQDIDSFSLFWFSKIAPSGQNNVKSFSFCRYRAEYIKSQICFYIGQKNRANVETKVFKTYLLKTYRDRIITFRFNFRKVSSRFCKKAYNLSKRQPYKAALTVQYNSMYFQLCTPTQDFACPWPKL